MIAAARDYSLESGERQTATTFAAVRADHRARYEWAAEIIGYRPGASVLDVFCGTGYGAQYLARTTHARVTGFDASAEAIAFARLHFPALTARYICQEWPCVLPAGRAQAVVSFESLEHVQDGAALFAQLTEALVPGGDLLLSVPNESAIPCATFGNPFHVRHYTLDDVRALAGRHGLAIVGWFGQSREGAMLANDAAARTLVFHLRSAA
jgi:2-polyprenyl-3-methyl-5-hydroxy-6-metoxy-1,4-benzoquinol methylase